MDIRHFKAQGYSFVKFDNKESAARAIHEMNGAEFMGQSIRCSWGKAEVDFRLMLHIFNIFRLLVQLKMPLLPLELLELQEAFQQAQVLNNNSNIGR